jgi:serine protease inhibitor
MTLVRRTLRSVLAAVMLTACSSPTDHSQSAQPVITALPRSLSAEEQIAASATTEFGLSLFRAVAAASGRDSSLALSPASASLALGMALNAVDGQTLIEVRRALAFGDRPVAEINTAYRTLLPLLTGLDPSVTMKFANSAWFDVGVPPSAAFSTAIGTAFGARVTSLPFAAPSTVKSINEWVSANTSGKIPKIVESLDPSLVAMLINATYFKGKWRAQFDASATRSAPFHVSASSTIQVPTMMTEKGLARTGMTSDSTLIAELPYGGDAFVMDLVVPPLGRLQADLPKLTSSRWRTLLSALRDSVRTVTLHLPKFRLETSKELKPALQILGMSRIFIEGVAETAPMFASQRNEAAVGGVLQKVFVDVNEEGTEAAAVTAIGFVTTSLPMVEQVIVDRPFLFVIRERLTGTILFIGTVIRPVVP